jgi:hypothetical protein
MKILPAFLALALCLTACGEDDPQPKTADPFLGTWKAESRREVEITSGQVAHDDTYRHGYRLEVTPTQFTEAEYANPDGTGAYNVLSTHTYTRTNGQLTVDGAPATSTYEAKDLTPTAFTYVYSGQVNATTRRTITVVYHR